MYETNLTAFNKTVNEWLVLGWVPVGGVCVTPEAFYQALAQPESMTDKGAKAKAFAD